MLLFTSHNTIAYIENVFLHSLAHAQYLWDVTKYYGINFKFTKDNCKNNWRLEYGSQETKRLAYQWANSPPQSCYFLKGQWRCVCLFQGDFANAAMASINQILSKQGKALTGPGNTTTVSVGNGDSPSDDASAELRNNPYFQHMIENYSNLIYQQQQQQIQQQQQQQQLQLQQRGSPQGKPSPSRSSSSSNSASTRPTNQGPSWCWENAPETKKVRRIIELRLKLKKRLEINELVPCAETRVPKYQKWEHQNPKFIKLKWGDRAPCI